MKKLLLTFFLIVSSTQTWAVDLPRPSSTPFDPLNLSVRMAIPNTTTTVAQAVMYVLEPTGYKLAVGYPASESSGNILMQPIPPEAFDGKVMTVAGALLMLIGEDHRLLIDPIHHLVSFDTMLIKPIKRSS